MMNKILVILAGFTLVAISYMFFTVTSANAGGKPLLYCVMVAGQDMGCFPTKSKCEAVSASYKGSSCKAIPCGENGTICPPR
jgi:hypothetical protein